MGLCGQRRAPQWGVRKTRRFAGGSTKVSKTKTLSSVQRIHNKTRPRHLGFEIKTKDFLSQRKKKEVNNTIYLYLIEFCFYTEQQLLYLEKYLFIIYMLCKLFWNIKKQRSVDSYLTDLDQKPLSQYSLGPRHDGVNMTPQSKMRRRALKSTRVLQHYTQSTVPQSQPRNINSRFVEKMYSFPDNLRRPSCKKTHSVSGFIVKKTLLYEPCNFKHLLLMWTCRSIA